MQDNEARRDAGNEGLTLDDFCKQPDARKAKLTKAHVLTLRLYTSNSYGRVNDPLRQGVKPHPFAATTFYIHDGIALLRTTRADSATEVRTFWRGLDDMAVSEEFMAQGGTEIGCMPTTETVAVARKFAKVGEKANPLLRLLKVEATSLMHGLRRGHPVALHVLGGERKRCSSRRSRICAPWASPCSRTAAPSLLCCSQDI